MSMRISKAMGYGLKSVSLNRKTGDVKDPRVNPDSPLLAKNKYQLTFDDYKKWLAANGDTESRLALSEFTIDPKNIQAPHNSVVMGGENYYRAPLLIIPPLYAHEWVREDSPIDYYEHSARNLSNPTKDSIRLFDNGFYPYELGRVDNRDGRKIDYHDHGIYEFLSKSDSLVGSDKALLWLKENLGCSLNILSFSPPRKLFTNSNQ
jgi:hypothetical protein